MSLKPFVFECGYNTSYIDSLLTALFYNEHNLEYILNSNFSSGKSLYLKEFINEKIIKPIRKNQSVNASIINNLRNLFFLGDWKSEKYWVDLLDPIELYEYLMKNFNYPRIEIIKDSNKSRQYYIKINRDTLSQNTPTSTIFDKWSSYNTIKNIPDLIPIAFYGTSKRIDIRNKINPKIKNNKYRFYSAICKSELSYYSLIKTKLNNKECFIIFNNRTIPCMKILNEDNFDVNKMMEKIELECEILFYIRVNK
jgi:hypothetical protein